MCVEPLLLSQPAIFVTNAGESQHKSVLQLAFLAPGTQEGHRKNMPSCAAIPSNLYSSDHTGDPLSLSLYLPLLSPLLLNLSVFVAPSQIYPLESHITNFTLPWS